jgi:hypothetical protein
MWHKPPWETAECSAGQQISRPLWNPKFRYRFRNSQPLVPIPRHINPLYTLPPHLVTLNITYQCYVSFSVVTMSLTLRQDAGIGLVLRKNFRHQSTEVPRGTVNRGLSVIARMGAWASLGPEPRSFLLPSGSPEFNHTDSYIFAICYCNCTM